MAIWPWSTINRLRREASALSEDLLLERSGTRYWRANAENLHAQWLTLRNDNLRLASRIDQLDRIVAHAHIRDPETGRLLKRGIIPPSLA